MRNKVTKSNQGHEQKYDLGQELKWIKFINKLMRNILLMPLNLLLLFSYYPAVIKIIHRSRRNISPRLW